MLRQCIVLLLLAGPFAQTDAQWQTIGNVDSYVVRGGNAIQLKASGAMVDVRVLSDHLVRIRCLPELPSGQLPPDHSRAVVTTDWPMPRAEITDAADALTLSTPALRVVVSKRPMRITVYDSTGTPIIQEHPQKGISWIPGVLQPGGKSKAPREVRVWHVMPADARYYGFGEKTGPFERRNTSMTMWNSDIPAYTAATDPLYQTIPFFLSIRNGRAHGVFFDNTYWSSFDMGKESRDQYSFGAEDGEMNYYVIAGPSPQAVIGRFTGLVGRMPLPPRWSLGYQQCRWSYAPEARVREIAQGFRSRAIPCDVIYLDIDYMEGYRVFTWNSTKFPDPRRLVSDLAADGFRTAVIMDPGIKADSSYAGYRSGLAGKHFLTYPDGRIFFGDVWPGRCAFPDFTSPSARRWWGDQMEDLIRTGVRGFWNDMNEPSVFNVPTKTVELQVIHHDDGLFTTHAKNHNIYGLEMTRASYEGAVRHNPAERPFLLTRASYAGGQRYSAAWTGDNVSSWEHLELALTMCLNLGLSGQPFVGSDIGGFIGYPSGELFARWLQLGAFTPLMRAHSVINEKNKEPWEFGDTITAINRQTVNLRYTLLPYIYNVMAEASATGLPAMRPLLLEYPDDPRFALESSSFLFGSDLLVAPVLWPGVRQREVRFPAGAWYDYWTGRPVAGGINGTVQAPLDRIPLYAKEGAILPSQQVVQHTGQQPIDPLTLTVFPPQSNGTASRSYYEDDGLSFDYLKGVTFRRTHTQQRIGSALIVDIGAAEGSYTPPSRSLVLAIVDVEKAPLSVHVNGAMITQQVSSTDTTTRPAWSYNAGEQRVLVRCADSRLAQRIELRYE